MREKPIIPQARQLARIGIQGVPTLFIDAGEKAWWRFIEFFTANIRNKNTREAYGRAVLRFSDWCTERKLSLHQLNPFLIAAYVEEMGTVLSPPSVKQHLAAIRMLFDFLVVGQIVPMNPASSVRGPKWVVKKGKTPVLTAEEARALLDSIDISTIGGLRDRAMIAVMVFSFARIGAVVAMDVEDFFQQGKRWWFRLHEKGGKRHDVPTHHKAEEYLDGYMLAAGIVGRKGIPLFCRLDRKRNLTEDRIHRREALAMIKRRARDAGLGDAICCHTFRATGITAYLRNGGTLERDQSYCLLRARVFSLRKLNRFNELRAYRGLWTDRGSRSVRLGPRLPADRSGGPHSVGRFAVRQSVPFGVLPASDDSELPWNQPSVRATVRCD